MTQFFEYSEYGADLIQKILRDHQDQLQGWVQEVLVDVAATEQNRDNDIEDYLSQSTYVPSISVTRSIAQSVADGGAFVQFEGISFQSTSVFDWVSTDNTKLTASDSGIVVISGNTQWDASAGGNYRTAQIYVNGADTGGGSTASTLGGTGNPQAAAVVMVSLLAGDYVQLYANQNTGSPLNLIKGRLSISYQGKAG